ncbi:GTPase [Streptomyces sp. NPDC047117]|uniref:GTPase n=1 Tax=Streptomyces sp. NPDC047117 TaxID=3155379 RepID=UPI0033C82A41
MPAAPEDYRAAPEEHRAAPEAAAEGYRAMQAGYRAMSGEGHPVPQDRHGVPEADRVAPQAAVPAASGGAADAAPGEPAAEAARDAAPSYAYVPPVRRTVEDELQPRIDALRELIGLSRTRLDGRTLDEAGKVLDAADERGRLSGEHTVVAIAGATGSGKSSLFNALSGAPCSEVAARRPTTSQPVACVWPGDRAGAEALLHRLEISVSRRYAPGTAAGPGGVQGAESEGAPEGGRVGGPAGDHALRGLVLLDLPDHDSAAVGHRAQVDRLLKIVDAVIWVVDPEKYADAVLHERYLRPLAGYAEVTFVVLNQVDRLPGDAADQVVDDLRRLLDEDGLALSEHGEPGATVLALSAATGEGVEELRDALRQFVGERGAAGRRLAADVDAAAERLQPVYVADGQVGLTEQAREDFEERLAEAVGAAATGRAAERDWLRHAERACATPWVRLRNWRADAARRREAAAEGPLGPVTGAVTGATTGTGGGQRSEYGQAHVYGRAAESPGAVGTAYASRSSVHSAPSAPSVPSVPSARSVAAASTAPSASTASNASAISSGSAAQTSRTVTEQAVRAVAGGAARGLPVPWAQAVREAADKGALGLPEALDRAAEAADEALQAGPPAKPRWWTVAAGGQGLLVGLQVLGALWMVGLLCGVDRASGGAGWLPALALITIGTVGGPALSWLCGVAARGPARRYGQDAERELRAAAAGAGRARVLEPVAAELLRYREVREQYAVAAGA